MSAEESPAKDVLHGLASLQPTELLVEAALVKSLHSTPDDVGHRQSVAHIQQVARHRLCLSLVVAAAEALPYFLVSHGAKLQIILYFCTMNQQKIDEQYMRRCLQLAECGRQESRPNPMVGAVIVLPSLSPTPIPDQKSPTRSLSQVGRGYSDSASCRGGYRILGEGYHIRCGEGHAEVNAFASVRPEDEVLLKEATIYVSLEPCSHYGKTPPCADLIINKGVRRVVVGCIDPFAEVQGRGVKKLRDAGIDVTVGVLEEECRYLNRRFFTFHSKHRPYIILKWAQTDDGFIDNYGRPLAISTAFTKTLVHKMRSEEDAILVGRVTDEREHPQLNVRQWVGKDPVRFVLSHDFTIDDVFAECRRQQLQSLIVEGGRKTLLSFIEQGLWDEARIERSPQTVGNGTPAPELPEDAKEYRRIICDGNEIISFRNPQESLPTP